MTTNTEHVAALGTWSLTIETPMGEQPVSVVIAEDAGMLHGTMTGPSGEVPLSDITANDKALRWKAKVTKPMSMTMSFDVTIDGNELAGTFKPGLFPKGKVRGRRG